MLLSVMHLRQAYHRDRGTQLTHCCCGSLRSDTRIGIGPIDMVFGRQPAGNLAAHSRSRGNDQWLPRTGDRYPHRFDEPAILLALLEAARAVMIESGVNHGVGLTEATDHAGGILDRTAMRSDERRVGRECVSPCRSRSSPFH